MRCRLNSTTVLLLHHYDACRPYLELAIQGLANQRKNVDFDVILLADSETCPEVPDWITLVYDKELDTGSKKVARGVKMSQTELLLIHSDDVILGEGSLKSLVQSASNLSIINPMSNSDLGTRFVTQLGLRVNSSIEDFKDGGQSFIGYESQFPFLLVRQPWLSFYCTLIPRAIFDIVGDINTDLEYRHNDELFCMKAAYKGIGCYIQFGAFAYHFGSQTLSKTPGLKGLQEKATKKFVEILNQGFDS